MYKRREISNVRFFGSLLILAGLLVSLGFPAQTKIQAEEIKESFEAVSGNTPENINESKPTAYGKTPLTFEANRGQVDKAVKFLARAKGYNLFLTESEAVFQLQNGDKTYDSVTMKLTGARKPSKTEGVNQLETVTNYFKGRDQSKWLKAIPNYEEVLQTGVYRGIDLKYYSKDDRLEYDFLLAPNADADQIRLNFGGAKEVSIDEAGNLILSTERARLVQQKPFAYQEINGEKREVEANFVISEKAQISFALGAYDRTQPLVIDPKISYLSYFGGSGSEFIGDLKVDSAGNAYVAGSTSSTNFPGPNAGSGNINFAAFVSKFSANGQNIIYTTFLDGSDTDGQNAFNIGVVRPDLAIDAGGNAYIAGGTDSGDFPVTANAYQRNRTCSRAFFVCAFPEEGFVAKLNPVGSLVYATYLGGRNSDYLHSIAVDSAGRAYVTGGTNSGLTFPKKNEFQGTGVFGNDFDAFLTVFNADGSDILYSTGLGGNDTDLGAEIALDAANNAYIVGSTNSTGTFPTKNPFQSSNAGGRDVFVAKFNTAASGEASLLYATFIGGASTDEGFGIVVEESGQAVITGVTGSSNFPLKNALRSTNQINEAFVTVLNTTGNALVNSTFLGGANKDEGRDIALGAGGSIYVTGSTLSTDFPTALAFQAANAGGRDAFVTKLNFGKGILSSSYLGGSADDEGYTIAVQRNTSFVAGFTLSNNLATTGGVFQPDKSGGSDAFVAKILDTRVDSVGVFRPSATFLLTQSTATVVSQQANQTSQLSGLKGVSGDWDGDGTDTIGSFSNGTWKYRNANFPLFVLSPPFGALTVTFGAAGDLPVSGDWDGDGIDTPGVFRINNGQGQFFLTDSTDTAPLIFSRTTKAIFGAAGDLPISGDWDGDGKDTIAVFRPSTGETFFTNTDVEPPAIGQKAVSPTIDAVAFLGISIDLPVAGDWNGDGVDSLGLWRTSSSEFFLSDDNVNLRPVFLFGQINTDQPIAGDWDGIPN